MSTLREKLSRRAAELADDLARQQVQAELAAYEARMGCYDVAQSIVDEIRRGQRWTDSRLSSAIFFADAMIGLRDEFSTGAKDRLVRAHAVAHAMGVRDFAARAAAWYAHFHLNQGDYREFSTWAKVALDGAERNAEARARLDLDLAFAAAYLGDRVAADARFSAVRRYAASVGDEAYMASSLYIRPACGVARARLDDCGDAIDPDRLRLLKLEVESALNYASATANDSARQLQELSSARLSMLSGDWSDAVRVLETVVDRLPEYRHPRMRVQVDADLSTALMHLGASERCVRLVAGLSISDATALEADDRVVYLRQLVPLLEYAGRLDEVSNAREQLLLARVEHLSMMDTLRTALAALA